MRKISDIYNDTKLSYERYKKRRSVKKFLDLPVKIQDFIIQETKFIEGEKYLYGSYINGSYSDIEDYKITFFREFFGKKKESDIDIMIKGFDKEIINSKIHIYPFKEKERKILIPNNN